MTTFQTVQELVKKNMLLAAHDVAAGGLVTTLLEMTFANTDGGIELDTTGFADLGETDLIRYFSQKIPHLWLRLKLQK